MIMTPMDDEFFQHAFDPYVAGRCLLVVSVVQGECLLERKKMLKEVETKRAAGGALTRIYEHTKTGEVFIIPDPQLRLDQLDMAMAAIVCALPLVLPLMYFMMKRLSR